MQMQFEKKKSMESQKKYLLLIKYKQITSKKLSKHSKIGSDNVKTSSLRCFIINIIYWGCGWNRTKNITQQTDNYLSYFKNKNKNKAVKECNIVKALVD